MSPTPLLLTTVLLLLSSTAHAKSNTHTTDPAATLPLYPAFVHLPTPPSILDATLLSAAPAPTETGTAAGAVLAWSIDCPSEKNKHNNACRSLSVFPAQLWHTQNGAWGGEMVKKGVTTAWSCDLAAEATGGASCVDTVSSKGGEATTTTVGLGCHGDRQLVPLRIQEGAEKFPEGWEGVLMGELNEQYGGGLEETGCAKTWTMKSDAPTVTRNETVSATGTATTTSGGVGETGTGTAGASDGSAVLSDTKEGAGGRMGVSGGLLVVGVAAAMWFGA